MDLDSKNKERREQGLTEILNFRQSFVVSIEPPYEEINGVDIEIVFKVKGVEIPQEQIDIREITDIVPPSASRRDELVARINEYFSETPVVQIIEDLKSAGLIVNEEE